MAEHAQNEKDALYDNDSEQKAATKEKTTLSLAQRIDARLATKVEPEIAKNKYSRAIDRLDKTRQRTDHMAYFFSWMPLIGKLFMWKRLNKERERRDSIPEDFPIFKPGILSSKVLWDTFTFKWLRYINKHHVDDIRDFYLTEYKLTGILSSVLFLAWTTFQVMHDPIDIWNPDNFYHFPYALLWVCATALALLSIISSIILSLAVNGALDHKEADHFIKMLNSSTLGFGAHCPLISIYLSFLCGVAGIVVWYAIAYNSYEVCTVAISMFMGLVGCFSCLALNITSSLYTSREAEKVVPFLPKYYLSIDEIAEFFHEFRKEGEDLARKYKLDNTIQDFENIGSEDDFVKFIREGLGKKERSADKRGGEKKENRIYLRQLGGVTEKLARSYYKSSIEREVRKLMTRKLEQVSLSLSEISVFFDRYLQYVESVELLGSENEFIQFLVNDLNKVQFQRGEVKKFELSFLSGKMARKFYNSRIDSLITELMNPANNIRKQPAGIGGGGGGFVAAPVPGAPAATSMLRRMSMVAGGSKRGK